MSLLYRLVLTLLVVLAMVLPTMTYTTFMSGVAHASTQEVFNSTPVGGVWHVPDGVFSVTVLVVAGGGGGGSSKESKGGAGGGGAGGVLYNATYTVVPDTDITVTVGQGGANATASSGLQGSSGSNSVFGTLTAIGGGGGGCGANEGATEDGKTGGSGGGGGFYHGLGGHESATPNQGYDGGDCPTVVPGAGGGGAGAVGGNAGADSGDGGVGVDYSAVFGVGVGDVAYPGWFAGGGQGGHSVYAGTNAKGGGGWAWYKDTSSNYNGDPNTGGGGGGAYSVYGSGNGGSGVVIIKYDIISVPTVVTLAATGNATTSTLYFNGNLTATGGMNSTAVGFVYGKVSGVLTSDVHTDGNYGAATFGMVASGLDSGTTYYFMAYATNIVGTGYGAELSAVTTSTPNTVLSWEVAGQGPTWVILKGYIVSGSPTTNVGFNYGLTTAYGQVSNQTAVITSGQYFVQTIYGLTPGTVYHWQAWATNLSGTGTGGDKYFSTVGSPILYEYINPTGNSTSGPIYGGLWSAQHYIIGNNSHSVTSIRLPLIKVGSPGTVTISLRHATTAGLPSGLDINDLDTATYNGNLLSTTGYTWVDFPFSSVFPQEDAGQPYAIVVRALSGDASNYIMWSANNSIGNASYIASNSTSGGASWTSRTTWLYLYEVWGSPSLSIPNGGIVVQNYAEVGDMLFAAELINTYSPYYPLSVEYGTLFSFQLLDTDGTTLLASVPTQGWDDKPAFLYLNAVSASALTPSSALYLRLYANFGNNSSTSYTLLATDWKSTNMDALGLWCTQTATNMEAYWEDLGVTKSYVMVSTSGTPAVVLTPEGGAIFSSAIPLLASVIPAYFGTISEAHTPGEMDYSAGISTSHQMSTMMGANFTADVGKIAAVFGLSTAMAGQSLWWIIALVLAIIAVAVTRSMIFGLFIGIAGMTAGVYFGMVNPSLIAVAAVMAIFAWGFKEFVVR